MEIALSTDKRRFKLSALAEDGLGFRFMRGESSGNKPIHVPRHHHPFAQIRWAEKGPRCYGFKEYIEEGDVGYFPRAAYYGPELLGDQAGLISTTLQFGFNTEYMPLKDEVEWNMGREGADHGTYATRLPAHGIARRGQFAANEAPEQLITPTERHPTWRIDSYPGVEIDNWRESRRPVAGQPSARRPIPQESYEAVIVMHPKAQTYYPVSSGVEVKPLGRFYDHQGPNGDTGLTQIRLSDDGEYQLGRDRAQLVWSTGLGLAIEDRAYPAVTSVYSPRGEELALACDGAVEVFVVEFPRLD
jgi:hypothetical protein